MSDACRRSPGCALLHKCPLVADGGHGTQGTVGSHFRGRLGEASVVADQVGSDLFFPLTGHPPSAHSASGSPGRDSRPLPGRDPAAPPLHTPGLPDELLAVPRTKHSHQSAEPTMAPQSIFPVHQRVNIPSQGGGSEGSTSGCVTRVTACACTRLADTGWDRQGLWAPPVQAAVQRETPR